MPTYYGNVKTEFEFAVRVTVDLARPVREQDRGMIQRAVGLAREIQLARGVAPDPALASVEQHLALPSPIAGGADIDRETIVHALGRERTIGRAATALGLKRHEFRALMHQHGVTKAG